MLHGWKYSIGLMHLAIFLGKSPYYILCIIFIFIFKSGNSPLENQYFSMFWIPLEPCCQRGFNGIWNVDTYWFSRWEFPLLKICLGCTMVFPKKIAKWIILGSVIHKLDIHIVTHDWAVSNQKNVNNYNLKCIRTLI